MQNLFLSAAAKKKKKSLPDAYPFQPSMHILYLLNQRQCNISLPIPHPAMLFIRLSNYRGKCTVLQVGPFTKMHISPCTGPEFAEKVQMK